MNLEYYGNGDFEFIHEQHERDLYKNMHNAITQTELWDWMRKYTPPSNTGFMFATAPEFELIRNKMFEDPISQNHSGSSYGCMMRSMEIIAKNGYDYFAGLTKRDIDAKNIILCSNINDNKCFTRQTPYLLSSLQ